MATKHWLSEVALSLAGRGVLRAERDQVCAQEPAWASPSHGESRTRRGGDVRGASSHDQRLNELRRAFAAGEPSSGEVLLFAALDDGLPWGYVTRAVALGVADHYDEAASRLPC
jgi:hypothetical protein